MTRRYGEADDLRGAEFHRVDLSGASFRDCDLANVRISSSRVDNLRVSGFDGRSGKVFVDDVDVTPYVDGELDRRHPERVQVRSVESADDYRAAWNLLEQLWSATIDQARSLSEAAHQERVDGEWSFVETLRHLVFAIDTWVGRFILQQEQPFSPLGLPPTDFPPSEALALGLDVSATPALDETVAEFTGRRQLVRNVLVGLTDEQLKELRTAELPVWGEEMQPVGGCLTVVFNEHCEHRRFALRDLARLAEEVTP